jgi:hypothetical protein
MYVNGDGVPQDDAEAVQWFRRAAEQGLAQAQHNLGFAYAKSRGVSQNNSEAVQWFRRAAEQGYADAQVNLGIIYVNGDVVSRNPVMAYVLSSLAATQGDEDAREMRDLIENELSREQIDEGQRMATRWRVGTPLPTFKDFSTWP